jgi:hypothetical protein
MEEEVGDQSPIRLAAERRKEYSPARKPRVEAANDLVLKGRKKRCSPVLTAVLRQCDHVDLHQDVFG